MCSDSAFFDISPQDSSTPTKKEKTYHIIYNQKSGNNKSSTITEAQNTLIDSGAKVIMHELDADQDFKNQCYSIVGQSAVDNSPSQNHLNPSKGDTIIVVAGGDGTVSLVADACAHHKVPMGIIPLGTFNYFARNMNIPLDFSEAIQTILNGTVQLTSIGKVNDYVFLNNASIGLYTKLIALREQDKARYGRRRIVAVLSALKSFLLHQKKLIIQITSAETKVTLKTTLLFVGVNSLQLAVFGLKSAQDVDKGFLGIVLLKPLSRLGMIVFILKGALKMLDFEKKLIQHRATAFEVQKHRSGPLKIVVDGEIVETTSPLQFTILPDVLSVLVPQLTEKHISK
jgi:diacylglycerol kinase family enzyme